MTLLRSSLAAAVSLVALTLASGAQAQGAPVQGADPACDDLAALRLPDTTIDAVTAVRRGDRQPIEAFGLPSLPAGADYCRVSITLRPAPGSEIHSEIWLPAAAAWNGKFMASGNAGFGGALGPPRLSMRPAVNRGYAVAGTDMGHTEAGADGKSASWALNQPERIIDFGHRANHVTAVAAKALIEAYYGRRPDLSYFNGCSDGGREALMAAQRYPDDFDGIIAGAAGNAWTRLMTTFAWSWRSAHQSPESRLTAANLTRIQAAVLKACDDLDGVTDGLIEDPRQCRFDPVTVGCDADPAEGCLTAPQIRAVTDLYHGPRRGGSGEPLYVGYAPGGEAIRSGWDLWITGPQAQEPDFARSFFINFVFNDPAWTLDQLDYDADFDLALARMGPILDSEDPDLSAFKASGGKLLMYHGWLDPATPPGGSIRYFEAVRAAMGGAEVDQFARLFMAPGMGHCFGGPGPNTFDVLGALDTWVTTDVAPDRIVAGKYANDLAQLLDMPKGAPQRTRPLCAYPAVARWRGEGSTDEAENFECVAPAAASGDDHGG